MRHAIALAFVSVTLLPLHARGAAQGAPVQAMYADARAKEQAVRKALAGAGVSPSVLKAVRTVVADYEALVRQYPLSAYSDDALWFGGLLSLDAFEKFGDDHDRIAATRLWRALATQYPTSKLAKQVPQQLARISRAAEPDASARAPQPKAARASEPVPPVRAPQPASPARVSLVGLKDIRRAVLPDVVRITIELDREVPFHDERIDNPARILVDLPNTTAPPSFIDRTMRFEGDADPVRQIRIGRQPNNTTRVVLDMAGISSYSVYPLYSPYRLVIDCIRGGLMAAKRPDSGSAPRPPVAPPVLVARALVPGFNRSPPAALPSDAAAFGEPEPLDSSPVSPVDPGTAVTPHLSPAPARAPLANPGGGISMARQLGLNVSRIVIDPGHGGHDPGAMDKGVTEAALVLDVSLRLEKLLAKLPGTEVILTRRTDDFVALQERTAIANREGADLFLSIHANASPNALTRGVETYFLNFATTGSAAALAARENEASGQPMAALPDFVKAIALNNKLDESKDFATHVQRALVQKLAGTDSSVKDLGVKQAPFLVLIGAAMPSVLAEISFLTNGQDAKLLRGAAYRQRIADALFDAIRKYQASLRTSTKIAQQ
jgi:N-acetylmuramoyl-L-alanine amidase